MSASQTIRHRAPAKLNLTLAVLGRRPDGFHELESWVVTIGWFDYLVFRHADELSLHVRDAGASLPADESNLVWRAAVALAEASGRKAAANIELEKHIAVGAGLGGGSSDAAATLTGLNALWELNWSVDQLMPLAAGLGSDVPLFLESGAAVIRGRGERVERLPANWQGWVALIVPAFGVSTTDVYRRWRAEDTTPAQRSEPWAPPYPDAAALSTRLFNDLADAAFAGEPRLAKLHGILDGLNGRSVHLTGSGSCLFALFDEEAEAEDWSKRASTAAGDGTDLRVVPTV